ncbi:MAG TPA: type II secretion system ATPase GspE [Geminicoccaceae bacterium]|nr:type II secretion system ATPase GspE [Geminicoccaceae bacterium]
MALADLETDGFEGALGQLLIERGKLDRSALERVARVRVGSQDGFVQLLPRLGLVSERDLAEALAETLDLPLVAPRDYPTLPLFEDWLSLRFLREAQVLPLAEEADGVVLAMADPLNRYAIDAIRMVTGRRVLPRVAMAGEIETALERLYGKADPSIDRIGSDLAGAGEDASEEDIERLRDLASEAPVIRLVNQLITRAVELRASDIHLECEEHRLRARFRIDGLLYDSDTLPDRLRPAIISRIKIMARLNIAERRLPQDGRIKVTVRGNPIDLRVSTVPTMHGESVVMRILDRADVALDFASLGIADAALDRYLDVLDRPHGILLVTGPTGSGKTTTLYTSLVRLNTPDRKIHTVEDPIEYQLEGINQIQVKQSIGLDFAHVLRSILRQDPDIIMVGEIRDLETAEIAVQAALTGHLVLSTLHTNNAASSITRLLDMGVDDYLMTSTLNGIVAQRLVRTLCAYCRMPFEALPEVVDQLGLRRYAEGTPVILHRPQGCEQCAGTGYFGRTSVIETLVITDRIRQLILRRAEANELHRAAVEEGMRTMYDDGMLKALAGRTTIEEVLKVTRKA